MGMPPATKNVAYAIAFLTRTLPVTFAFLLVVMQHILNAKYQRMKHQVVARPLDALFVCPRRNLRGLKTNQLLQRRV